MFAPLYTRLKTAKDTGASRLPLAVTRRTCASGNSLGLCKRKLDIHYNKKMESQPVRIGINGFGRIGRLVCVLRVARSFSMQ
jgi:hypothetical protein